MSMITEWAPIISFWLYNLEFCELRRTVFAERANGHPSSSICFVLNFGIIRASHSLLSHCSPHMRQACCGSPCTLWSFSSLIKVVMMSLRCWLLLLVVRQLWFFGKYAVFAPEIWSGDSGNVNKKKKALIPFSAVEHVCSRGRHLTIAQGQCVTSYVLGVPFIFRLFAAFVVQSTPPYECKIETLPQEEFVTPACLSLGRVFPAVVGIVGASFHSFSVRGHKRFTPTPLLLLSVYSESLHFTPTVPWCQLWASPVLKDIILVELRVTQDSFLQVQNALFFPDWKVFQCIYLLLKRCLCLSAVLLHSRSCTAVYSSSRWPLWHTPILRFGER